MNLSRRDFLKASGSLSFAFSFPIVAEANTQAAKPLNAWVRIAPDGTVTILSTGAEMGQGSMTSLPLILADEMDADWSKVKIEWAPADPTIYGYTFQNAKAMAIVGSRAVMLYYNDLRIAGAQVRKVLLANAAEHWKVPVSSLKTENGVVLDGSGRKLTYGEIASFAKVPSPLPAVEKSELKDKSQFRFIGKDDAAARHAAQGERLGAIRDRREPAGNGVRDGAAFAGARRLARELERGRAQVDEGRARHGAAARRRGDHRRQPAACDGGARSPEGELEQERRGRL